MNRINALIEAVSNEYEARNPNRSEWSDWLYDNHVFLVSSKARELAEKYGASGELAEAAGMLHDIADSQMSRFDPKHEQVSLTIARRLMLQSGFTSDEIAIVVDDAIYLHGCKDGKTPNTLEGKVMATADAFVHLTSDFYDFAKVAMLKNSTSEIVNEWAIRKIERDFNEKIFFNDVRESAHEDYVRVRRLFV